ncbi:unnamed protein product, partial [Symbiodinium pilosum]
MAKVLGALCLISVLAEKAFQGETCEDSSLLQLDSIEDEFPNLIHVNTHFHLGAEHCNFDDGEYDVKVGYTYEFHWVFSTAGPKDGILSGGLGGVFARDLNPSVVVRGQVARIVNDPSQPYPNYNTTWFEPINDAMLYIGSTTSDSFNNEMCSPFE